jgi:hypothetical protein
MLKKKREQLPIKQKAMRSKQRASPRRGREPKCTQEERKLQHFRRLQAVVASMKVRGCSFAIIQKVMWEQFRVSIKEEQSLFGKWTLVDRANSPGLDPDA